MKREYLDLNIKRVIIIAILGLCIFVLMGSLISDSVFQPNRAFDFAQHLLSFAAGMGSAWALTGLGWEHQKRMRQRVEQERLADELYHDGKKIAFAPSSNQANEEFADALKEFLEASNGKKKGG